MVNVVQKYGDVYQAAKAPSPLNKSGEMARKGRQADKRKALIEQWAIEGEAAESVTTDPHHNSGVGQYRSPLF